MTATLEKKDSWLAQARESAWAEFKRLPAPAKTVETWRRVDFSRWRLNLLDGQTGGASTALALDPELAKRGVVLLSLEDAAARHPALVEPYLKSLSAVLDFAGMEAANLARFAGGAFLYVPKNVRIELPIEMPFVQDARAEYSFPRALVIVDDGAEATIVESHFADDSTLSREAGERKASSIAFSRLVIGAGARVRYFYDQTLPLDTAHFWHQQADLGKDALLQHYSVLLGAGLHKSELDVRLAGQGARSELYGLLLGSKSQQFDPHTVQWHKAPKSSSDLLFRTALKDRAKSIYTGLIRIEKEAVGCDAFQQNNNLLLSNSARADSTPVLEILTNDVRCKHGATVGPVREEELFYLCSRGLTPEEASKLLVLGFFEPVLGKLPLDHQKERLLGEIEARL